MAKDIVVGLDDSSSARAALTWAAAHARATGARLRAVHVLDASEARELYAFPVLEAYLHPDDHDLDPAWTAAGRRTFERIRPEPSWTLQFGQGHPGQVLVDASRDAELLVLGTREHRGLGRLVNGSVSHFCFDHATCPVLAVPSGAADAGPSSLGVRPEQHHRTAGPATEEVPWTRT